MSLPSHLALTSTFNGKYIKYLTRETGLPSFLTPSEENLVTVFTNFKVESAKTGNGSFFHLRSVFNNMYWVRYRNSDHFIIAGASEPNEDLSDWACTLFEPSLAVVDDNGTNNVIRLRHVHLGFYVSVMKKTPQVIFDLLLFAGSADFDPDHRDIFKFTDLSTLFVLPKHITFRGFHGGYLTGKLIDEQPFLQFLDTDVNDPTVWYEAFFSVKDGTVGLKSNHFAKFLRRSPDDDWVLADANDTAADNLDTLFWSTPVEDNTVAIQNLGNNLYCNRLSAPGKASFLSVSDPTITDEAKLKLEETLNSRSIFSIEYQDYYYYPRFYGKRKVVLGSSIGINEKDEPETILISVSYTNTISTTWNSSISHKVFSKVNIEANVPTIISTEKIEISADIVSKQYNWGETIKTESQKVGSYSTIIPAKSIIKVSLTAIEISVDIPFNYSQRDTLIDGNKVVNLSFDDGLYTRTNFINLEYETIVEPINE